MKQVKSTSMGAKPITFRKLFVAAFLMATACTSLQAQNTSADADLIPIAGGNFNAGFGVGVLIPNSGNNNTALGYRAMTANTSGSDNAAVGYFALAGNSTGGGNTAVGAQALELGAVPSSNTAVGTQALRVTTGVTQNTAVGHQVMVSNTTGGRNAAVGIRALALNTIGASNAAFGAFALTNNTTAGGNTAIGRDAMINTTTGGNNTGVGGSALSVNTIGTANSSLGFNANVSANNLTNATAIGNTTVVNASNKVRIGNAAVTVVEGPVAYTFSDGRFKTNVRTDDVIGLDFIQRLRPVVYNLDTKGITEHWTQNMSAEQREAHLATDFGPSTAIRQSGFIAQEVEQAAKAAGYDFNGVHTPVDANDNYSVSYSQFVVPLVKGMQEQQAQIAELQAQVRALQAAQGMQPDASAALSVFPNPSHGSFTIEMKSTEATNYEVRDITGRLVFRGTLSAAARSQQLNLSGEAKGTYVLRVFAGERLLATEKLIVE